MAKKLLNTKRRWYLHPAVYAQLAGAYIADGMTRKANECINRGIEAALILALELDIPVNPNH